MPTLDALDGAAVCADSDLVLISQGGIAKHATRGQLIATSQPLLPLAQGQVLGRASAGVGVPEALRLGPGLSAANGMLAVNAPLPGDAVAPEAYGAVGDGLTDDSAAFIAAIASGKPVRLGPKTYAIAGQWTIGTAHAVLLGTPGLSVLKRIAQTGGAFISIQADGFVADGVTFDANRAGVATEAWNVLVTAACHDAHFRACGFLNGAGASLGSGLTILQGSGVRAHTIVDCTFANNAAHGLWVQAVTGVRIAGCLAHDNAAWGINVDFNDPTFAAQARLVQVTACRAWNNVRGIAVGNFNASNATPPVWGNANPDAVALLVAGNICHDNTIYGISAAGLAVSVNGNLLSNNGTGVTGGAGILANVAGSAVTGNMITSSATYGIDCGGSQDSEIGFNQIQGGSIYGINCGGSTGLRVALNRIKDCTVFAICAANTEADGQGHPFPLALANLVIADNAIAVPAGAGGVWLRDGGTGSMILRNAFTGPIDPADALRADTDGFAVEGNRCNAAPRPACNPVAGTLAVPDIADAIRITQASAPITSMLGASAARAAGAIRFVRISNGGSGYTTATLAIAGTGTGAAAQAVVTGGTIIGAIVTSGGTGYGAPGQPIAVTVTGDGAGAQAVAYAGAPLADARRLTVNTDVPVRFAAAAQTSWLGTDLDVAALGDIEFLATANTWRASRIALSDWFATDGTGGAVLKSTAGGDVALHPNGTGHVRITSDNAPTGIVFAMGHGSPDGVVVAPPGSDYRNLDGGPGQVLWLKRVGVDAFGWVALA
jgi:hypothetical protein